MKMKKRFLSLFLAMALSLGLALVIVPSASATEGWYLPDWMYPNWVTPDAVTITTQTQEDVRVTTPVYSACGSLFWNPDCGSPVESINNIWLTIEANSGVEIREPSLQITLELPDGFEFRGINWCSQTYESYAYFSGNEGALWWELPDIYPTYVGDAEPGDYYYVKVQITGTFKYRRINETLGNANLDYKIGELDTYSYVPFLYVVDAWDSVEVTHPDIGNYTIRWAEEDAYQSIWSYNNDTALLCAALSAISGDKELTMSTLAKLGFTDFEALTGDSAGGVNGIGLITATKYLTDTAYTISVLVDADDPEEWMGALAVNNGDYYSAKIYEAAYKFCELESYGSHSKEGAGLGWRYGEYRLFTGFGQAGAAASVMAKMQDGVNAVAYTFGAPNVRRQEIPWLADHGATIYNLVYWQDPICASPSGQYYQSLGETYYVLESAFDPVRDQDGDGYWTDQYGITYKTVTWTGDYVDAYDHFENVTQYTTVNELVAAALYAWDPYDPDADGISADTVAYLAQVNAILGQNGLSLSDVSSGAHSMSVYWKLASQAWRASSTNAASLHYRLSNLYNNFFAPKNETADENDKQDEEQNDQQDDQQGDTTTPTTPGTQTDTDPGERGTSMECHVFEGNCSVTVTDSSGNTVASITSSPYDAPVARSSVTSVLVCVAGNQKLVMITDPRDTYTITVTGSEQDQESTVTHTVYQTASGSETVTVLTQGAVLVSPGNSVTVPAVSENNISAQPTEDTYTKSTVTVSTSGASVPEQPPVFYEGNPGAENKFTDVSSDAYYADAVAWAVTEGITTGTSETTFSPNASCTRAQAVTFLWRAAGSPDVDGDDPFSDVSPSDYYYKAVLWAVQNGITLGTSDTTFGPDLSCQRSQIVTFLYRYAGEPSASGNGSFADVPADSYYYNAVQWAVENNVTTGTGENSFSPDSACTRAQIVTFLYRLLGE